MTAILLTAVAMVFFAANSLLTRSALRSGEIDAATFTLVRIAGGAAMLAVVARGRGEGRGGNWWPAVALFGYAAAFTYAYLALTAGTGALVLFAAVEVTMLGAGIARGERPMAGEWLGLAVAFAGFVYLVAPGVAAPSVAAVGLMAVAGVAWGAYSIAGRGAGSPTAATAGNFARAVPMAAAVWAGAWWSGGTRVSGRALALATLCGAVTSGIGYAIWYAALRQLRTTVATMVQLTVPAIAAGLGVVVLGEAMTWRLVVASAAILGGVGLAVGVRR